MNASVRPLITLFSLLILLVTSATEAVAARDTRSNGSTPSRYSVVEEYKESYRKPRRTLFGKRKLVSHNYARKHRRSPW